MYRTEEEVRKYIEKIFSDRSLFEWEVLHVSSHYDRLEVMQILAQTIVRDRLKFELNFLYIKRYEDFKLSQIINILFHEIANEWLSFATEILYCSKNDAINALQDKKKVKFIHSLVKSYYATYKRQIFEVIADTFIELVSGIKHVSDKNILIEEVLESDLIKNRQILKLHNFSYLWSRVKAAQNMKNSDIISTNIKIHDIREKYKNLELDTRDKEILLKSLKASTKELEKLKYSKLDTFDTGVKRLKDVMVHTMLGMDHLSSY